MRYARKMFRRAFSVRAILVVTALATVVVIASLVQNGNQVTIEMTDTGFQPSEITISQGDTVVFRSTGERGHWVASNYHPTHTVYPNSDIRKCGTVYEPLLFDACTVIEPGEEYRFTFHEAGVWNFHDHVFARYSGRVTVRKKNSPASFIYATVYKPALSALATFVSFFQDPPSKTPIGLSLGNGATFSPGYRPSAEELATDEDYEAKNIFSLVFNDLEAHRVVNQIGIKRALEKMYEESEDNTLFRCHQGAHYIGHAAYNLYGLSALSECTPLCSSGCYHGVAENWLIAEGDAGIIPKISESCSNLESKYKRDQCFHGAGHGFTAYTNYEIPKSLELCSKFNSADQQSHCYSGVFMENLMAAGGLGLITGHVSDWVSWEDLYYPCNAIGSDSEMLRRCYERQTTWMFVVNDLDVSKVLPECLNAPINERGSCFFGIGRDYMGNALGDTAQVQKLCESVSVQYRDDCITGAADLLVRDWSEATVYQAKNLCSGLPGNLESICFDYVIQGARDVYTSSSDLDTFCKALDEPYASRCIGP